MQAYIHSSIFYSAHRKVFISCPVLAFGLFSCWSSPRFSVYRLHQTICCSTGLLCPVSFPPQRAERSWASLLSEVSSHVVLHARAFGALHTFFWLMPDTFASISEFWTCAQCLSLIYTEDNWFDKSLINFYTDWMPFGNEKTDGWDLSQTLGGLWGIQESLWTVCWGGFCWS